MAKIINPGWQPITLMTGHVVPKLGELETTNAVIMGDNWPRLHGLALAGEISLELDPEEEAPLPAAPLADAEPEFGDADGSSAIEDESAPTNT